MSSELPPNERPPTEDDHTAVWTIVGVIVLFAIAAGAMGGFFGGRVFNSLRLVTDAEVMRLFGALPIDDGDTVTLTSLQGAGPAWAAGLAEEDRLLSIDGQTVTSADNARRMIANHNVGDEVRVVYERDFSPRQTVVVIGVRQSPTVTLPPPPTTRATSTPLPPINQQQRRELAQLGVTYRTITEEKDGDRYGVTQGAIILAVEPNGPASRAGIQIGDIILGVGVVDLSEEMTLERALSGYNAGERIRLRVLSDGVQEVIPVTLGR